MSIIHFTYTGHRIWQYFSIELSWSQVIHNLNRFSRFRNTLKIGPIKNIHLNCVNKKDIRELTKKTLRIKYSFHLAWRFYSLICSTCIEVGSLIAEIFHANLLNKIKLKYKIKSCGKCSVSMNVHFL